MKIQKIIGWFAVIISVILLFLPRIIPICTGRIDLGGGNFIPMKCHFAYQAEFLITLLAVIFSAGLLVLRTSEARLLAGFLIFLLRAAIVIIPQPWALGICPEGGCQQTTFFEVIAGLMLAVAGIAQVWHVYKARQEETE
jgi:hypothetical protein